MLSHQIAFTVLPQHLIGLITALLLFSATRRVTGLVWAGLLPAPMVLLGPDEILLEHAIMSEGWAIAIATDSIRPCGPAKRPSRGGGGRCRRTAVISVAASAILLVAFAGASAECGCSARLAETAARSRLGRGARWWPSPRTSSRLPGYTYAATTFRACSQLGSVPPARDLTLSLISLTLTVARPSSWPRSSRISRPSTTASQFSPFDLACVSCMTGKA